MAFMLPGVYSTFSELEGLVEDALGEKPEAKLMGMLFMRRGQSIADKDIIPSLEYFDLRSADNIHFVLPGWEREEKVWRFDEHDFAAAISILEDNSTWKYSGGTELLLFAAQIKVVTHVRSRAREAKGIVDLSSAIRLHIDLLRERKVIDSPERLFEIIFSFAKNSKSKDPVRGLAFQEARVSLANGIAGLLRGIIPKDAKEQFDYASEFAVKDLSSAEHKPMIMVETTVTGLPR